jgi:hypothetical protein
MRSTKPVSEIFKSCPTQGSRTIFGHPQIDQSSVCQPCENWLYKGHRPPKGGPSLNLASVDILYLLLDIEPLKVVIIDEVGHTSVRNLQLVSHLKGQDLSIGNFTIAN